MSEPDYKNDLIFIPVTVKSNLEKIESHLSSIKDLLKELPEGQIKKDLSLSVINDLSAFETRIKIWKEILNGK